MKTFKEKEANEERPKARRKNTKRSAQYPGRNGLCLTSETRGMPLCSHGYKNKKLRAFASEFLFVVAPTGIEPVFHT